MAFHTTRFDAKLMAAVSVSEMFGGAGGCLSSRGVLHSRWETARRGLQRFWERLAQDGGLPMEVAAIVVLDTSPTAARVFTEVGPALIHSGHVEARPNEDAPILVCRGHTKYSLS